MKSVSLKPGLSLLLLTVLLVTNFYSSAQEDLIPFNKYVNGDSKWGYYNTAGQIIVAPKYFEARKFDNGLGKVSLLNEKVEWRYGFVDATGKEIIPLNYSHIDDFSEGLVAAEQYGKTGFLNREGKTVIPFVFENAHDQGFKEGLVAVKQNGKWGFKNSIVTVPERFDSVFTICTQYYEGKPFKPKCDDYVGFKINGWG